MLPSALPMSMLTAYAVSAGPSDTLAPPESFAAISDTAARSAALFTELGKVLTHPRCVNCHPAGDRPRQADVGRLHQPPVERGPDGLGLPAMRCPICHQQANFDPGRVPGNPIGIWHRERWRGKARRSVRSALRSRTPRATAAGQLEALVEHIGTDHLVGWAWAPGYGRRPAPGTQKEAGALVEAWVKTGAVCPN